MAFNNTSNSNLHKLLVSKIFRLNKNEKKLLDETSIGHLPEGMFKKTGIRGRTSIDPFMGQSFSESPKVFIRNHPAITSLITGEDPKSVRTAYRTPEETLLHELGHVRAGIGGQSMRALARMIYPEKLHAGEENAAERFAKRVMDTADICNLKLSDLFRLRKKK